MVHYWEFNFNSDGLHPRSNGFINAYSLGSWWSHVEAWGDRNDGQWDAAPACGVRILGKLFGGYSS